MDHEDLNEITRLKEDLDPLEEDENDDDSIWSDEN